MAMKLESPCFRSLAGTKTYQISEVRKVVELVKFKNDNRNIQNRP
jgi:hypothetical protein